jgi:hypothetical protein
VLGTGCVAVAGNRGGRPRRSDVPEPDFEIADLTELRMLLE